MRVNQNEIIYKCIISSSFIWNLQFGQRKSIYIELQKISWEIDMKTNSIYVGKLSEFAFSVTREFTGTQNTRMGRSFTGYLLLGNYARITPSQGLFKWQIHWKVCGINGSKYNSNFQFLVDFFSGTFTFELYLKLGIEKQKYNPMLTISY